MSTIKNRRRKKKNQKTAIIIFVIVAVLAAIIFGVALSQSERMNNDNKENSQQAIHTESENADVQNVSEDSEEKESKIPEIEDFTMFFSGDIMLQNSTSIYDDKGINGILSEYLEQEMVDADMTVTNNEFAFSTGGTKASDKQFTFRVNPTYVSALQDMGVDVASLANNHALDYGQEALVDTFTTLDHAGISYVGAGETKERAEEAVYVEAGGRTVGVLSASRVIPVASWNIDNRQPGLFCTYDSTRLVERIKEVKEECDYVVVFVHWGIERANNPEEYQRNLAKQYIDAGADLVVGNHPHVPQGIEYYKGVPIVYSLGNYIFNQNMVDTYALKVLWDIEGNTTLQVVPIDTANYYTSELSGDEEQSFYKYLEGISYDVSIDENGIVTNNTAE